jgi:GntR family transcriptional regulator
MMKNRDSRLPLYQRLADEIRDQIASGKFKPGDRIPSENEFIAQYGAAAGTVRQALQELVDEKILERIHGRGTFVKKAFDSTLFRFFRFNQNSNAPPESRMLSRELVTPASYVQRQLKLNEGDKVIHFTRLRLIDGQPALFEEINLKHEGFEHLLDYELSSFEDLLYPMYAEVCDQFIFRAEDTLCVEESTAEIRRLLRIDESLPIVAIERLAFNFGNTPVEWRRSRGRADYFKYRVDIR